MQSLDLFKSRKYSVVKLSNEKDYKIPNEYSVEEVERLLELREAQEALESQAVNEKDAQLKEFWIIVFEQLEIIFQHYQPEVTSEYLKATVTHNEALEILGFFQKYRHIAIKELKAEQDIKTSKTEESKKKVKSAKTELRDLRRVLSFMVVSGFSLFDLRKLYIDELYAFYDECIYSLEKLGKLKEGSYDKIKASDKSTNTAQSTVNLLRQQMFKSIAKKNK